MKRIITLFLTFALLLQPFTLQAATDNLEDIVIPITTTVNAEESVLPVVTTTSETDSGFPVVISDSYAVETADSETDSNVPVVISDSYLVETGDSATDTNVPVPISDSAAVETTVSADLSVAAKSAILMEASTGTILYEKNSHERLRPASVTKIMTLILIFEALEKKQIELNDYVTVSAHASSMGGSQVYLETGETQSVNDLIKCISIASANDACVAMAEFIDGTEEAFVAHMNAKAKELGMNDTTFVNCCGLDADGHLTSAYDIALMSRELSVRHPQIHTYCTIWMDQITHTTRKGTTEFGLTNTNKLVKQYDYVTGLKTGYTKAAKYCLSATATKKNLNLISVVMAEESIDARTRDVISMLDYGFSHCNIFRDKNEDELPNIRVKKGTTETVPVAYESMFQYVITDGTSADLVKKRIELPTEICAPIKSGDVAGKAVYYIGDREIGSVLIRFTADVKPAGIKDHFRNILRYFFMAGE